MIQNSDAKWTYHGGEATPCKCLLASQWVRLHEWRNMLFWRATKQLGCKKHALAICKAAPGQAPREHSNQKSLQGQLDLGRKERKFPFFQCQVALDLSQRCRTWPQPNE
jgi:hypothetical protein